MEMATVDGQRRAGMNGHVGGTTSTNGTPAGGADNGVVFGERSLKRRNFKKLSLPPNLGLSSTAGARFRVEGYGDNIVRVGEAARPAPVDGQSNANGSTANGAILNGASANRPNGVDTTVASTATGANNTTTTTTTVATEWTEENNSVVAQLASLQLGVEFKLDLEEGDFETIAELGSGNGGKVSKVRHTPTQTVMAKKVIHLETKPAVRRQIARELHIMHDCDSEFIVSYYGGFVSETSVTICMEYMDCGSLDRISKRVGPISEQIIAQITVAVVEGLTYLYNEHRIIHRDVKPSNVLVNSRGQIKLCDFGVSGELINSIAETFVGTSTYMSPERIQGATYTVKGDVWSLGLTVLELAIGRFPFSAAGGDKEMAGHPGSILDLLQRIVNEAPPQLPDDGNFSQPFRRFVTKCLYKEEERPTPQQLLNDAFFLTAKHSPVSVAAWARSLA